MALKKLDDYMCSSFLATESDFIAPLIHEGHFVLFSDVLLYI
jgi:hypothetical protein